MNVGELVSPPEGFRCVVTVHSPTDSPPPPSLNGDPLPPSQNGDADKNNPSAAADDGRRSSCSGRDSHGPAAAASSGSTNCGNSVQPADKADSTAVTAPSAGSETKRRPPLTRGISRNKSDPKILPVILFAFVRWRFFDHFFLFLYYVLLLLLFSLLPLFSSLPSRSTVLSSLSVLLTSYVLQNLGTRTGLAVTGLIFVREVKIMYS